MKTMQDFYLRLASPDKAFDHRLSLLSRFSKARLAVAASEGPWFWWESPQPIVNA